MDIDRFANLLRSFSASHSRRGIARALGGLGLGGALGARGLAEADAGKRRKRRRRRKKRKQKQNQNPPHVCQGRDVCIGTIGDSACSTDPNCFCFETAEGEPYCGKGNTVASCAQCEQQFPGRDCFPGTGPNCGAFACVTPCPV